MKDLEKRLEVLSLSPLWIFYRNAGGKQEVLRTSRANYQAPVLFFLDSPLLVSSLLLSDAAYFLGLTEANSDLVRAADKAKEDASGQTKVR